MGQRQLLMVLVGVLVLGGAAALWLLGGDMLGPGNDTARQSARHAGTDEHGSYFISADGSRVYEDSRGRRYILGPDGERIYVDQDGRPLDRPKREADSPDGRKADADKADTTADETADKTEEATEEATEEDANTAADEEDEAATEDEAGAASLSGSVVDESGQPYPNVRVTARGEDFGRKSSTTDENGEFTIDALPAEVEIVLRALGPEGNPGSQITTRLASGATRLPEPLVVVRDAEIRGIVRDAANGSPLTGVWVRMSYMETGRNYASVRTEADGRFSFAGLRPDAYRLQVALDGYAPRILNEVRAPATLEVHLEAGAAITGRVLDPDGAPVAGARLICRLRTEPMQDFETRANTDSQGEFVLRCQPESQHNNITVSAPGFETTQKTLVRAGTSGLEIRLERRDQSEFVVIRGRAAFPDGKIHPFIAFLYDEAGHNILSPSWFMDSATGDFAIDAPVRAVRIRVASFQFGTVDRDLALVPGQDVDLGTVLLDGDVGSLLVHVADADTGGPVAGARVAIAGRSNVTRENGRTAISGVPREPIEVTVTHPAYETFRRTVEISDDGSRLEFRLARGTRGLNLLVTDSADNPLSGAQVRVRYQSTPPATDSRTWQTGPDGRLVIQGIHASTVTIEVSLPDYLTATERVSTRADPANAPLVTVKLARGNALTGRCTSNGEPLPGGVTVEVFSTNARVAQVLTDSDGRYVAEVEPGTYYVGLPDYGFAARRVEVTLDGGRLDLELGPVSHARGRILRHDGSPHGSAGVYVYRRDNLYWTQTVHTAPDGSFEIRNLFPGEWVLTPLKSQGDTAAQFSVPLTLSRPGWNDVTLQLPRADGVITGRVTYPSGQPVARARVAVTNLDANFERALLAAWVVTDDQGYYRAERLENGARMQVRVGGYAQDAHTGTAFSEVVTVPAGAGTVQADIEVPESGLTFSVSVTRADGGPFSSGGPLGYLFDTQGRLSGLYFGGGRFDGSLTLRDVVPGTYTLVVTWRGMQRAETRITVGTTAPTVALHMEPEGR